MLLNRYFKKHTKPHEIQLRTYSKYVDTQTCCWCGVQIMLLYTKLIQSQHCIPLHNYVPCSVLLAVWRPQL
jgi:hypothetical protein